MNIYKRGDKHPTEELYWWSYRKDRDKTYWVTKEKFEELKVKHALNATKRRVVNPINVMVSNAIGRDITKYFSPKDELITVDFINKLIEKQQNKCYWLGIPMISTRYKKGTANPLKLTVDRIDSTKGYTKENTVLCSYLANSGKSNTPPEEWNRIVKLLKDTIIKEHLESTT